jgi:anti-anti-sigma factor
VRRTGVFHARDIQRRQLALPREFSRPGVAVFRISGSVQSCDPAGLAVLVGTQRRARLFGTVVRLVAPSLPVAKLLRLTGLDRSLRGRPHPRES